ncbi:MAG: hypothetical protein GXP42_11570 [Chloroflexi bacterium]|nr:hypothetical protein [Chloroflexota bacterium]
MSHEQNSSIAIVVHGGAGRIAEALYEPARRGCAAAVAVGWSVLKAGGSALDAVEEAVRLMEIDPMFNAGRGSVLNAEGRVEMDAGIMDGAALKVGATALIQHVRHPISLARRIMERTPHHFLAGENAERFAREQGLEMADNAWFITERRLKHYQLWQEEQEGDTVGAVALDRSGNLAAANSTGGVSFKMPGRVGDSPLPGAGFYADNRFGAVATTGQGEHIMRVGLALRVMQFLEEGLPAREAALRARDLFLRRVPGGVAGWIVLDARGGVGIVHTTPAMSHAYFVSGMDDLVSGMTAS